MPSNRSDVDEIFSEWKWTYVFIQKYFCIRFWNLFNHYIFRCLTLSVSLSFASTRIWAQCTNIQSTLYKATMSAYVRTWRTHSIKSNFLSKNFNYVQCTNDIVIFLMKFWIFNKTSNLQFCSSELRRPRKLHVYAGFYVLEKPETYLGTIFDII